MDAGGNSILAQRFLKRAGIVEFQGMQTNKKRRSRSSSFSALRIQLNERRSQQPESYAEVRRRSSNCRERFRDNLRKLPARSAERLAM
jgi:hypothetical protein